MKLTAITRFDFTAELWDYYFDETEQDPETGEPIMKYEKVEDIKCAVYPADLGTMSVFTRRRLRRQMLLRNLRDREGNPVFANDEGDAVDAFVEIGEPIFNIFGVIEGHRHDLIKGTG